MAQEAIENELADVVVAAKTEETPSIPWYVVLRPWLFCLVFLILVELVTRAYYDTGISLQTERFDNFPTPALENAFIAQMQRDRAYKVAVIGDSTVVGAALLNKEEAMPRCLEAALKGALPDREIHVWNFGLAGARAADMLCLFKKVQEGRPDFVVIDGNYFITAEGVINNPLAEPWLAYNLREIPACIQPLLKPREPKTVREERLTSLIEENVRFIGLRQAINAKVFGVQPRFPYEVANPVVMSGVRIAKTLHLLKPVPWSNRDFRPEKFIRRYANDITSEDLNGRFQRALMEEVRHSGLPAFTYLTPQNPTFTSLVLTDAIYQRRRAVLASFLSLDGIACKDYSELVPEQLFVDNDHLLAEGNRRLAEAIAQEIRPRLRNPSATTAEKTPVVRGQ